MKTTERGATIAWPVLLFVMSGVFLSTMDSGMQNVALPWVMRSLGHRSMEQTELLVTVYLLTISATLIFWGALSDRIGKARVYLFGLALFSLGAFCCFGAGTFTLLLLCRCLQALGASMMMSSGPAIIKESLPPRYLGRGLGLVGIATACGLLTGPAVSGELLLVFSWRYIFLVSALTGALILGVGLLLMKNNLPFQARRNWDRFDLKGSCCWVAISILTVMVLTRVDRMTSPVTLLLLVLLFCAVLLFVYLEKTSLHPIVPLTLISRRYYWIGITCAMASFVLLFSVLVLLPFYLDYVLGVSVDAVGVVMMAVPATLMVTSPGAGFLYDKIGARVLTTLGLLISCSALLGLAFLSASSSLQQVACLLALLGAGQSIFLSPNSASVLSKVEDRYLATTSGILATARNFGMVIGATLAASLFSFLYSSYSNGGTLATYQPIHADIFVQAWQVSCLSLSVLAMMAAALSFCRD